MVRGGKRTSLAQFFKIKALRAMRLWRECRPLMLIFFIPPISCFALPMPAD
jgi:hypothetical protein